ncbi:MAG: ABC transporter ATP-binding protein, partial [Desulfovibrionaceae bacterium]|nr:ABC transporter ATP-binding protein [Desulfovibrionaceae bacterium]
FVDEVIFLRRGGQTHMTSLKNFMESFTCYRLAATAVDTAAARALLAAAAADRAALPGKHLVNVEAHREYYEFFSFADAAGVMADLSSIGLGLSPGQLEIMPMNMEDAFVGYTGRC